MGLTQLYCAEQIVVPDKFPNLLKGYAKAAVRTQPSDLLKWSAAYFRCLALNEPPPAKRRLETTLKYGTVTRELLRVLLVQLGKGYFVKKELLFEKWDGVCLPEHELLTYMSLCRMLKWSELHWLKLFAVMVGSINENFKATVRMLCELLTDELDGSLAYVPLWMFKVCYQFIAALDCAGIQEFYDGRKVLVDGRMEDEIAMPAAPKIYSVKSFQDVIVEQIKYRMLDNEGIQASLDQPPGHQESTPETVEDVADLRELTDTDSNISSSFAFAGNLKNPFEVIRKSLDFDTIIVMMKKITETAPKVMVPEFQATDRNLAHAAEREVKIQVKREALANDVAQDTSNTLESRRQQLVKQIGPPWAWLHEFATQNSNEKSYNFLEHLSLCSDRTPTESSDQSFDFLTGKFIKQPDTLVSATVSSTGLSASTSRTLVSELVGRILSDLICDIGDAEMEGKCSLDNVASIISYLDHGCFRKEEVINDKPMIIDFGKLRDFLTKAEEKNMVFNDLNELNNYFIAEMGKCDVNETIIIYEKTESEARTESPVAVEKVISSEKIVKVEPEIEDIFDESGIEVDPKLLNAKISSSNMILGLASDRKTTKNPSELTRSPTDSEMEFEKLEAEVEESVDSDNEPQASSKETQTVLQRKKFVPKPEEPTANAIGIDEEKWVCSVRPMLGIGKAVSSQTIERFLHYLTTRACEQNGQICPENFEETGCPPMEDVE